jgi:hypothetical protein
MGNEMTLGDKNNMGKWITDNGTEFVRPRRLTRTEFVRQKGGQWTGSVGFGPKKTIRPNPQVKECSLDRTVFETRVKRVRV